jgi:long-subunit fatty acid transport protein
VGIDYPLKSFRVGLGFSQRYNSVLGMDAMEITTEYQPEGTGEFFTAESNNLISCYSLQFSRAMDNLIMTGDQFCIGIRFNYNRVDFVDRIYHTEAKASGGALGGALGLRYGFSDNVQVGIFYERNPYFKEKFEIEGTDLVIEHDPLIGGNNPVINAKFDNKFFLKDKLPDRLTMGFLYRVNEKLEMTLEAAGIYWHQWDDRAVNSVEISGGLLGHITRHFSLSMSLLSTDRKYKDNTASYIYESQEALFLLAGVNVHLESVDFDVALAKTVAYDKWRKQSIAKFSLGYHL